jgi:LytS/YehU family sensor histidine kinase
VEKDLFENLFDFHIDTNNLALSEFHFPPMLLQPLVENSIKHGFMPEWNSKVGFLTIHVIEISDNSYQIIIEDNGIGYANAEEEKQGNNSVSTNSIKSRVDLLNDLGKINITLDTISPAFDNRGTKILITVVEIN